MAVEKKFAYRRKFQKSLNDRGEITSCVYSTNFARQKKNNRVENQYSSNAKFTIYFRWVRHGNCCRVLFPCAHVTACDSSTWLNILLLNSPRESSRCTGQVTTTIAEKNATRRRLAIFSWLIGETEFENLWSWLGKRKCAGALSLLEYKIALSQQADPGPPRMWKMEIRFQNARICVKVNA